MKSMGRMRMAFSSVIKPTARPKRVGIACPDDLKELFAGFERHPQRRRVATEAVVASVLVQHPASGAKDDHQTAGAQAVTQGLQVDLHAHRVPKDQGVGDVENAAWQLDQVGGEELDGECSRRRGSVGEPMPGCSSAGHTVPVLDELLPRMM